MPARQGQGQDGSDDAALIQDGRGGKLDTSLGKDKLALTRFRGCEILSALFEYDVEAVSDDPAIDFTPIIGTNCCVTLHSHGDSTRYYNGVLTHAQTIGVVGNYFGYRLTLKPWLWLLGHRADCRIFKSMTVTDIIKGVFKDAGFSDYEVNSHESYPTMEYCVQYRESDLTFVLRLMEEFGLYYYHKHEETRHVLVITDSVSSQPYLSVPNVVKEGSGDRDPTYAPGKKLIFRRKGGQDRRDVEHIYDWQTERRFRTGVFLLNDYDYMQPKADIETHAQGSEGYQHASFKAYDYPGRYVNVDDGNRLVKVRLQAEQSLDHRRYAAGDALSLSPGVIFELAEHSNDDGEYTVVRADHEFTSESYRSGAQQGGERYVGHFELQKKDRQFRALPLTAKPRVYGPQTAFVVDTDGKDTGTSEEIEVDKEGRVLVRFHWMHDSGGKKDYSRRVRVAQTWAGKGWGGQVIPRIGQEVVVEFLDGDPDQPLVVGTVYNKDYRYPYDMPDNKTMSGMKSDSSKGHGGYNEFKFEDKKSSEKVVFRAEKDLESVVQNSETRDIGKNFETSVGSPSRATTLLNGDENLTTKTGDWNVDIANNIKIEAKGSTILIKNGMSSIEITPAKITIKAPDISIEGTGIGITINAPMVKIN